MSVEGGNASDHQGSAGRAARSARSMRDFLRSLLQSERLILYVTALYFFTVWPFAPDLASSRNLLDIVFNVMPLLVVAVGQTLVLITGGIDLSATSIISITSVFGAVIMSGDGGWMAGSTMAIPVAIGGMLILGSSIGFFNGLAITRLGMPPFMVTLCTIIFVSGVAEWTTEAESIGNLPEAFVFLGYGRILLVPLSAIVAVGLALLVHFALGRSVSGRWLYAVGHNRLAARASGVPVGRSIVLVYTLSGFCAGLASVLYTARLETGSPVIGERLLLDVIGAVVLGGTSLFGGKGKVSWTFFGVLFMTVVSNSLLMLQLSFAQVTICKGLLILAAALLDAWRHRSEGASR